MFNRLRHWARPKLTVWVEPGTPVQNWTFIPVWYVRWRVDRIDGAVSALPDENVNLQAILRQLDDKMFGASDSFHLITFHGYRGNQ